MTCKTCGDTGYIEVMDYVEVGSASVPVPAGDRCPDCSETAEEAYQRGLKDGHKDGEQARKDMLDQISGFKDVARLQHDQFLAEVKRNKALSGALERALPFIEDMDVPEIEAEIRAALAMKPGDAS